MNQAETNQFLDRFALTIYPYLLGIAVLAIAHPGREAPPCPDDK